MMPQPTHPNIPARAAGINLKPAHYDAALSTEHEIDFFEFHAENFMATDGPPKHWLGKIRDHYPISLHGVSLSVGGLSLDLDHLEQLACLVDEFQPALVSEHLAWSQHEAIFFNDLIAPPMTQEALNRISDHIGRIQDHLKRSILIENPSSYIPLAADQCDMDEPEFLNQLVAKTGCQLLLDINNVYISAHNTNFCADEYLTRINADAVTEIHLAGHLVDRHKDITILIDDHGAKVSSEVMALYQRYIDRVGPRSTLIEWDKDIPSFEVFEQEIARVKAAQPIMSAPLPDANDTKSYPNLLRGDADARS